MGVIKYFVVGILLHCSSASHPIDIAEEVVSRNTDVNYRLPFTVNPEHYVVRLSPDMDNFTFTGDVTIKIRAKESNVDAITLHSRDLHDYQISIEEPEIEITEYNFTAPYDFLVIYFNQSLKFDEVYTIRLQYNGIIQSDMTGFYRSSYVEDGQTKWLALAKFQPVHTRKAFPCFDEPIFKSYFVLEFDCPAGYTCKSNMKVDEGSEQGPFVRFATSPKMSSYLVAFVVSQYVSANETTNGDLRIIARRDAGDMGDYPFGMAEKLQIWMDDYFKINYYDMDPSLKLDHVAIPDYISGATENWGLVLYREAYLMYEPGETSVRYRQLVASILSHEIVHMWFGNYITCHWWSDTWLNEGFARFYEFFATEEIEAFGLKDQFIVAQVHTAMVVDTPVNSAPLTNPNVNSPAEVSGHFSTITYNKGGSVIRMIQHWIGDESYINGLRALLNDRKFNSMVPGDLFKALDQESDVTSYGTTVTEVMESWTSRSGYPLLTVHVNRETSTIIITQQRFVRIGQSSPTMYNIPITYTKQGANFENTKPTFIMMTPSRVINEDVPGWIIFNVQQTGFYRVNYDSVTWDLLIEELNGDKREDIHRYNRAQIVDDAFNLAREDQMTYTQMLNIIQFLEFETDYTPWSAAFAGFNFMRLHIGKNQAVLDIIDSHILKLIATLIKDIGMNDVGTNLRKLFRTNTLNFACNVGHDDCIKNSIEWFEQLKNGTVERIPVNLREPAYCNGLRYGDKNDYDFLWKKHDDANVVNEKLLILGAMGCPRLPNLVTDFLMKTIDRGSGIRDQDRMTAFNSALNGNPSNAEITLDFIFSNLKQIKEIYGSNNLRTMMTNLSLRLSRSQLASMESSIRNAEDLTPDEKTFGISAVENGRSMRNWSESHEDEVYNWIYDKYNSAGSLSSSITLLITMLMVLLY